MNAAELDRYVGYPISQLARYRTRDSQDGERILDAYNVDRMAADFAMLLAEKPTLIREHQYELPDMGRDLPCAICGRPVRALIHVD